MTELPPAFVSALQAERETLNARFAMQQRGGSRIDSSAFLLHLEEQIAPLIEQVNTVLPERACGTLIALYDASLELFAASLLGPDAKIPWVQQVWASLLPVVSAELLARHPQQVAGCLSNAAFQIASQRGARPQQWLDRMRHVAAASESLNTLLEAGKVAAWQAGMVQLREAALAAADKLPAPLAGLALGMKDAASPATLATLLRRLREHIWLSTVEASQGPPEPAIAAAATVGAFTGFGGDFYRPPQVTVNGQLLLVSDGKSQWELLADAYGAWFRRIASVPHERSITTSQGDAVVDRQGTIRWGRQSLAQPHLAEASSVACNGPTLAVTIPTSHHVFLYRSIGPPA